MTGNRNSLREALIDLIKAKSDDIADVFLETFAEDERLLKFVTEDKEPTEVFEEAELLEFVGNAYEPDDMFSHDTLAEWAEKNGYIEEEEKDEPA